MYCVLNTYFYIVNDNANITGSSVLQWPKFGDIGYKWTKTARLAVTQVYNTG